MQNDGTIWNVTGDDKYNQGGLEHNKIQSENTLWNVMGGDESNWDGKELNGMQCEGFDIYCDRRQWILLDFERKKSQCDGTLWDWTG